MIKGTQRAKHLSCGHNSAGLTPSRRNNGRLAAFTAEKARFLAWDCVSFSEIQERFGVHRTDLGSERPTMGPLSGQQMAIPNSTESLCPMGISVSLLPCPFMCLATDWRGATGDSADASQKRQGAARGRTEVVMGVGIKCALRKENQVEAFITPSLITAAPVSPPR